MTARVTHARLTPPRGGARAWWAKAWQRAVEEAAFAENDLRRGRAMARASQVGGISVGAGSLLAAVRDGDDAWTVEIGLPVLDDSARSGLVDAVAAESGRIAALLAGDLPHDLIEHADEVGAELLPYGGEFAATCTCDAVLDPCPHAIAVLVQAGWLVEREPLVLFALRGLDRDGLLAALNQARTGTSGETLGAASLATDVEVAADAMLRAQRLVAALESDDDAVDELL